MKYITLLVAMMFSGAAMAISECGGKSAGGSWVSVVINTTGPTGIPDEGTVTIEREGNKFGYKFVREDITQFFENEDPSTGTAMVGLAAYVEKNNPVSVRYVGENFVDMDLKAVVEQGKGADAKGNFMRIWRGPGYDANSQYQVTNVVCSVWTNL
ncbi:MAG: hypothetical protein H7326_04100 [Bdellovibrionaceae bacterium]|nr:hypothetical protein [Pseudobdellovibrionaceae bacterium]